MSARPPVMGAELAVELARHVALYHRALVQLGAHPKDALTLTRDYQRTLVSGLLRPPRGKAPAPGPAKDGG